MKNNGIEGGNKAKNNYRNNKKKRGGHKARNDYRNDKKRNPTIN
jgi:hypothetical protein